MYIHRALEPIIQSRVKEAKSILVAGPRQAGKSTMLKEMFAAYSYATLDDDLLRLSASDDPSLFLLDHPAPLIIDEAQKATGIFNGLKIRLDESRERGRYILTGSQQTDLMALASESLSGRISVMELQCLSLREIHGVSFNRHFVPTDDYLRARAHELRDYGDIWETIHEGCYPELYDVKRDWNDFYSSYVKTYLDRDINQIVNIKDSLTFLRFMTAAAARVGSLLNYANIASEVGVSEPTIKGWISVLERTGIVFLLQPYSASSLHRAIRSPKLYFRDTGLACYLSRWLTSETLKNGAMAGHMFENFVITEIIKSYVNEGLDYNFSFFFYRGKDRSDEDDEIDFIIEENGIIYPIEIKMTANPKASMTGAFRILDKVEEKKRGRGVIICQYPDKTSLRDNLISLPLAYL